MTLYSDYKIPEGARFVAPWGWTVPGKMTYHCFPFHRIDCKDRFRRPVERCDCKNIEKHIGEIINACT